LHSLGVQSALNICSFCAINTLKNFISNCFLSKIYQSKDWLPPGGKEKGMGNSMVALKTADEVKAVIAELAKNKKTNLFRCLWAMQFESALRFGDAVKLTWDQFAEGKTHLSIKQEKTGKLHKVTITPAMRSIVQARREEAADRPKFSDYIFSLSDLRSKGLPVSHNAVLTEYGKCGRRAGFQDVGSHTPRKSKAVYCLRTVLHWNTSQNCWAKQTLPQRYFTSGSHKRLRTRYQKSFLLGRNGNDEKMHNISFEFVGPAGISANGGKRRPHQDAVNRTV
jgi:hypothetical protein